MMQLDQILKLYDEHRRTTDEVGFRREDADGIVRSVGLGEPVGWVSYSNLSDETADEVIEAQKSYFSALGCRFEWKWYAHDRPADLKARLTAHGFEPGEEETIVVLDLQQDGAWTNPRFADATLIRKVQGFAELKQWSAVPGGVFAAKDTDILSSIARELERAPDRLSIYTVVDGDVPVSVGWLRLPASGSHFASLWGGSTIPACRRRGYYSALVAARVKEARDRGARFLTVDALPTSRPILERLGFRALTTSVPMNWPPQSGGCGSLSAVG